jgi:hypothetical protein
MHFSIQKVLENDHVSHVNRQMSAMQFLAR